MGEKYPELTSVLERLIDDKAHPLNMVTALLNPSTRPRTIAFLSQLAAGKTLCGKPLQAFLAAHPGRGPLFEKLPDDANHDRNGRSRKTTFLEQAKTTDPARRVGGNPNAQERALVEDYANRLRKQVEPLVFRQMQALTKEINDSFGGNPASFSVRTKTAEGIIDKVQRIDKGRSDFDDDPADLETKPNPGAQVGDLIDAVGARITVQNTDQLARLLQRVQSSFGTGDAGRIIEIENFYASPKARSLAYRVIPLAVVVTVGGLKYTFELQLTTRRASVAADLNHNTVYKNLIGATPAEQRKVSAAFSEAAAIEQLETRGELAGNCGDSKSTPTPTTTTPAPKGAAGSFVLVSSKLTDNPWGKEVTVNPAGGTAHLEPLLRRRHVEDPVQLEGPEDADTRQVVHDHHVAPHAQRGAAAAARRPDDRARARLPTGPHDPVHRSAVSLEDVHGSAVGGLQGSAVQGDQGLRRHRARDGRVHLPPRA